MTRRLYATSQGHSETIAHLMCDGSSRRHASKLEMRLYSQSIRYRFSPWTQCCLHGLKDEEAISARNVSETSFEASRHYWLRSVRGPLSDEFMQCVCWLMDYGVKYKQCGDANSRQRSGFRPCKGFQEYPKFPSCHYVKTVL